MSELNENTKYCERILDSEIPTENFGQTAIHCDNYAIQKPCSVHVSPTYQCIFESIKVNTALLKEMKQTAERKLVSIINGSMALHLYRQLNQDNQLNGWRTHNVYDVIKIYKWLSQYPQSDYRVGYAEFEIYHWLMAYSLIFESCSYLSKDYLDRTPKDYPSCSRLAVMIEFLYCLMGDPLYHPMGASFYLIRDINTSKIKTDCRLEERKEKRPKIPAHFQFDIGGTILKGVLINISTYGFQFELDGGFSHKYEPYFSGTLSYTDGHNEKHYKVEASSVRAEGNFTRIGFRHPGIVGPISCVA